MIGYGVIMAMIVPIYVYNESEINTMELLRSIADVIVLDLAYLVLIPAIARRASTDYSLYNGRILNEYLKV